jgi:hypothetical protein
VTQRSLDIKTFKSLASKGLSCKDIAKKMGYHPNTFGLKMKEKLGVYPSVYIAGMKYGKT